MTIVLSTPPPMFVPEVPSEIRASEIAPMPTEPAAITEVLLARLDARRPTVRRDAFVDEYGGRSIELSKVGASTLGDAAKRAVAAADHDGDGRVTGRAEADALFSRLDHLDRDGDAHSIRTHANGAPLALGRVLDVLAAASRAAPPPPIAPDAATNTRLLAWYSKPANYAAVHAAVGSRTNMCAMFVTTALEKSGALDIPHGTRFVGYDDDGVPKSVRAWAPSLARYLETAKGWPRIHGFANMKPGDLLFTHGPEGTYNHVMVLESWIDQHAGRARVIDNQGFTHPRNLGGAGGQSPVAYAVRAPT